MNYKNYIFVFFYPPTLLCSLLIYFTLFPTVIISMLKCHFKCISNFLFLSPSLSLSLPLSLFPSLSLSLSLSIYLSIYIYLSISLCLTLSLSPSFYLCISIYLYYISIYICLSQVFVKKALLPNQSLCLSVFLCSNESFIPLKGCQNQFALPPKTGGGMSSRRSKVAKELSDEVNLQNKCSDRSVTSCHFRKLWHTDYRT